jgi:hypothetical protein
MPSHMVNAPGEALGVVGAAVGSRAEDENFLAVVDATGVGGREAVGEDLQAGNGPGVVPLVVQVRSPCAPPAAAGSSSAALGAPPRPVAGGGGAHRRERCPS